MLAGKSCGCLQVCGWDDEWVFKLRCFLFKTKFGGKEKTLHWTSTLNSGTFREIAFALIGCFWPTLAACDLARVPSSVGFSSQFFSIDFHFVDVLFLKNVFKKGFAFPFRHWKKKKSRTDQRRKREKVKGLASNLSDSSWDKLLLLIISALEKGLRKRLRSSTPPFSLF